MVATKINVDALLSSKRENGKTVGEILTELNYPTESLKNMYSFQQILELDTIKNLLASQNTTMPIVTYQ